jgi:hypothetical protein
MLLGQSNLMKLNEEAIFQVGEDFKVNYFLVTVDMATASLKRKFEEL